MLLAGVLAAILVVRLLALALNRTDLFFDEAQYWYWSTNPAFGYYSKPPAIAWVIAAATSVCGTSEACIRLPAPILHTATALAVGWLGTRLYGPPTGVLAGIAFALLPGVSFSAGIVSTDVPLLLCWALALTAFASLVLPEGEGGAGPNRWWPTLLLGASFGLGLNAKYAMAWLLLGIAVYLVLTPSRRGVLRDVQLWAGLALGLLLIAPNMAWNQANAFATFAHTADNAKWTGSLANPGKAAEFLLAQFGVFGPLYFAGLLVIGWRAMRPRPPGAAPLPEADRLLLAFTLPLVVAVTIQAFLSRAHANWAAPAYVAGTVLIIATLVREASWGWLRASYAIHAVVLAGMVAATSLAGLIPLGAADPFARTMGWRSVAEATRAELARARAAGRPFAAIISDDRALSASLAYYMRNDPTPIYAWRTGPRPMDHFELTRPYAAGRGEPVLLVSLREDLAPDKPSRAPSGLLLPSDRFATVVPINRVTLSAASSTRSVAFVALSGYKAP